MSDVLAILGFLMVFFIMVWLLLCGGAVECNTGGGGDDQGCV